MRKLSKGGGERAVFTYKEESIDALKLASVDYIFAVSELTDKEVCINYLDSVLFHLKMAALVQTPELKERTLILQPRSRQDALYFVMEIPLSKMLISLKEITPILTLYAVLKWYSRSENSR